MTERLSDVAARIGSVRQLSAVIAAMRGIAAARAREAENQLDGIRAYAGTIAGAIGRALAFQPARPPAPSGHAAVDGRAVIALCAEQGFAGAFSEHVLDAAGELLQAARSGAPSALMIVGDRGSMVAAERELAPAWSCAMIVHVGQAADVASRIVEEVYRRIEAGSIREIFVVHAGPDGGGAQTVRRKRLVPFDFARFPAVRGAAVPLTTLPPEVLLERLAEEYVFAELCEALVLSYAAENEARLRAMIAAKTNVATVLDGLVSRSRQLRQEEITNEILELAAGAEQR